MSQQDTNSGATHKYIAALIAVYFTIKDVFRCCHGGGCRNIAHHVVGNAEHADQGVDKKTPLHSLLMRNL